MSSSFHAQGGWFFKRQDDGSVKFWHGEEGGPEPPPQPGAVLDHGTWCSIVAHVSAYGDQARAFAHASAFHDGRVEFGQEPVVVSEVKV